MAVYINTLIGGDITVGSGGGGGGSQPSNKWVLTLIENGDLYEISDVSQKQANRTYFITGTEVDPPVYNYGQFSGIWHIFVPIYEQTGPDTWVFVDYDFICDAGENETPLEFYGASGHSGSVFHAVQAS